MSTTEYVSAGVALLLIALGISLLVFGFLWVLMRMVELPKARKITVPAGDLVLNRMHLSAALETLSQAWDEQSARDVVKAFDRLTPFDSDGALEIRTLKSGKDEALHGLTELGNAAIGSTSEPIVTKSGTPEENQLVRVGRWKVYHTEDDDSSAIEFYDFREDHPAFQPGSRWQLSYDAVRPYMLVRWDSVPGTPGLRIKFAAWFAQLRVGKRHDCAVWDYLPTVMYLATEKLLP